MLLKFVIIVIAYIGAMVAARWYIYHGAEKAKKMGQFYRNGIDCPYMGDNQCELFLEWVLKNRHRMDIASLKKPFHNYLNCIFFITRPYIMGGFMFITIDENGVELNVAKNIKEFYKSYTKVSYCPNWDYVSTRSKKNWLELYSWYEEQLKTAEQKGYSDGYINPKVKS